MRTSSCLLDRAIQAVRSVLLQRTSTVTACRLCGRAKFHLAGLGTCGFPDEQAVVVSPRELPMPRTRAQLCRRRGTSTGMVRRILWPPTGQPVGWKFCAAMATARSSRPRRYRFRAHERPGGSRPERRRMARCRPSRTRSGSLYPAQRWQGFTGARRNLPYLRGRLRTCRRRRQSRR